ncbi:MAG: 4Fe-4S dicluster domain-containing protein [Desulfobacteraceae bacterium]|nr:MAG: 4Fe-4S dicluster domain-containing protein [Desulfobacteraceae bacterium]
MKESRQKDPKKKKCVVEINREWCKGCGICIAFCPKGALRGGDDDKASWDREKCIACGACELRCPDMAIEVKQE